MPVVIATQIQDLNVLKQLVSDSDMGAEDKAAQIKSAQYLKNLSESDYDIVLLDTDLAVCCKKLHAFMDMMLGESNFELPDGVSRSLVIFDPCTRHSTVNSLCNCSLLEIREFPGFIIILYSNHFTYIALHSIVFNNTSFFATSMY